MAQREPEKAETLSKRRNMLYSCRNTRNVTGCLMFKKPAFNIYEEYHKCSFGCTLWLSADDHHNEDQH